MCACVSFAKFKELFRKANDEGKYSVAKLGRPYWQVLAEDRKGNAMKGEESGTPSRHHGATARRRMESVLDS